MMARGLSLVFIFLLAGKTTLAFTPPHTIGTPSPSRTLTSGDIIGKETDSLNHRIPQHHRSDNKRDGKSASTTATCTALHAVPVGALTSAAQPLLAVSVLAAIVCFHEIGHYSAAKLFGIKVEEFSVGVGPRLANFKAFGNEFNLRALLLGGYVRFPEHYNATDYQVRQREAYVAGVKNGDIPTNVTVQNELLNIVTLGGAEYEQRKKRIAEYEAALQAFESLPFWAKFRTTTPRKPVFPEDVEIEYNPDPQLLQNRPWTQRAVVICGGVIFNFILSFSLYFGQVSVGSGLPKPVYEPGVVVSAPPRVDGASKGLLQKGDIITSINGQSVTKSSNAYPTPSESQASVNNFISQIRANPEGERVMLSVLRANSATTSSGKLERKALQVEVTPRIDPNNRGPQTIGVMLAQNFVSADIVRTTNVGEAAQLAYDYTAMLTSQTVDGFKTIFAQFVSPSSGSNSNVQISGPVGLIRAGSEVVGSKDATAVILFAAAISINLGVVNALPLPALDGGQLVFILAEAITGKKIDQRIEEGINGVAVLLLLLLSLSTVVGDVSELLVGR